MIEFKPWPKIARLFRDVVITEKIDGTNSAVGIKFGSMEEDFPSGMSQDSMVVDRGGFEVNGLHNVAIVYAQSRKTIIAPHRDNHGFAGWVYNNAAALVEVLGEGVHFGAWWGSGINRGYGLTKGEHRFSLFNTKRWAADAGLYCAWLTRIPELAVVPILYQGPFSTLAVRGALEDLKLGGSHAQPQFMNPEGVIVYHTAGNVMFKATLKGDEMPKSGAGKQHVVGDDAGKVCVEFSGGGSDQQNWDLAA